MPKRKTIREMTGEELERWIEGLSDGYRDVVVRVSDSPTGVFRVLGHRYEEGLAAGRRSYSPATVAKAIQDGVLAIGPDERVVATEFGRRVIDFIRRDVGGSA